MCTGVWIPGYRVFFWCLVLGIGHQKNLKSIGVLVSENLLPSIADILVSAIQSWTLEI